MRLGTVIAMMVALQLPQVAAAQVSGEPGNCVPPCRSGFYCKDGKCVSQCNPPCPPSQRCVKGDCEPIPMPGRPTRQSYLALLGVFHGALHSAKHLGEIRLEFAGKYSGLQVGPAFGEKVMMLRSAIMGRIPFKPFPRYPLFFVPTVALGYAFGWVSDAADTRQQDIFIAPGFRVRYDLLDRMAVLVDLLQLQINFLRLQSDKDHGMERIDTVPVTWNLGVGLAFLY